MSSPSHGPLVGLTIVEFAGIGPGPLAGQILADLGADVISIDRAPLADDPTDINRRGKRSVVLNLKSADGVAQAKALLAKADVLIEGFRPGVMERLGLGPSDLPDTLIYARVTGWGQTGPLAQSAGHDINYLAITGALAAIGRKGEPPVPPLNLAADFGGGTMFCLLGILAALYERGRSGRGQVVDVAMSDGVPALMGLIHTSLARGEWALDRESNLLDGGAPFYRCYTCADGGHVAVGAIEAPFFAVLVDKLGLDPAWRERQNDRDHWPALTHTLEQAFLARSRDAWGEIFAGTDGCVTPVLTMAEAPHHPHNAARGTFLPDPIQAAPAPRFSRTPGALASR